MEVSIQRTISLTHADENSTPREIEQEAAELDNFLRILTEVFWNKMQNEYFLHLQGKITQLTR